MPERMMCRKCIEWLSKLGGKKIKYHSVGKDVKETCYCCGRRRYVQGCTVEEEENDAKLS